MDTRTVAIYDESAAEFSDRYNRLVPTELHATIRGFFHQGGRTADIGCGSGRDAAWLNDSGYPTIGYDASESMLGQARAAFPDNEFIHDSLPDLRRIPSSTYDNLLCSAVLMHLRREELITACTNLSRILQPNGRILISYRESQSGEEREDDGRLFTQIPAGKLVLLMESVGLRVLLQTRESDSTRPGVYWTVILAEKSPLDYASGLQRVQSILVQDAKTATYKLALIRAFCRIGRTQSSIVRWHGENVYVPMWAVAVEWLIYYWPLLSSPKFIAQLHAERIDSRKRIAFRPTIEELAQRYGSQGLWLLLRDLEARPLDFRRHLQKIANTIEKGPVTFAGTKRSPVFHFAREPMASSRTLSARPEFGWIGMPEGIWLDICRFDHWIEDSVIMRWAALTAEMNPGGTLEEFLPYLILRIGDDRDTTEVRSVLRSLPEPLLCVWTDRPLTGEYHVDHAIPYAIWGNNDYWNLLPCHNRANLQKSDLLPSQELIQKQEERIVSYWRFYRECFPARFDMQISRALGCAPGTAQWEKPAIGGLKENVQRLSASRGLSLWTPSG